MEKQISIDGIRFELLGTQRGGAAVYRGEGAYMRIGERSVIEPDLAIHRLMEKSKFPVAKVLGDGEIGNLRYFVEESLGNRSFRAVFQDDMESATKITDGHFDAFVAIAKKLYAAQLKASDPGWHIEEFAEGVKLPALLKELPDHADAIRAKFETIAPRLARLPGALTHGDMNPANMYEKGIIDLEDSFRGPVGYDIVSAFMTIEWSPDTRNYEFFAQYKFTPEQKAEYLKVFDKMAQKAGLSEFAKLYDDFAFCRAVWLCTGMQEWPRIQQWRFDKFVKEYLS